MLQEIVSASEICIILNIRQAMVQVSDYKYTHV